MNYELNKDDLDRIYLAINAECVQLAKKFNIYDVNLSEDNNAYFHEYMELSRLNTKVYHLKQMLK